MNALDQDAPPRQLDKVFLVLIVFWSLVIAGFAAWSYWRSYTATVGVARAFADESFSKDLLFRRWGTGHGGVYIPITPETPPSPYLAEIPERDISTPSGKKLTLMNPAYMMRQVYELGKNDAGPKGHITSLNPIRPENAADEWEKRALQAFERGEQEVSAIEHVGDETYYRFMRPLFVEDGCLKCHAMQGYEVGDVRGGISVSVPWTSYREGLRSDQIGHGLGYGTIWIIGIVGLILGKTRLQSERKQTEEALRERTKELQCLYAVSTLAAGTDRPMREMLEAAVCLIPAGWFYPEITCARIVSGGQSYTTENFRETPWQLHADAGGAADSASSVDVFYLEERPKLDEGPFVKEERLLIDELTRILRTAVERRHAQDAQQESEKIFAIFLRLTPVYVYIKEVSSTESRVLRASDNFQQMIGISGTDMVGKTMAELFAPELAAKIRADDWSVVSKGEAVTLEEELNGRSYTTIKFPIALEGRSLLAGYTIDVTERKRAEETLRQQSAELTIFDTAGVDRELVMIGLKQQVNALSRQLGQAAPYDVDFADAPPKDQP